MNNRDLDRHITGNWGEDQYKVKEVGVFDVAEESQIWDEKVLMNEFGYPPSLAKACFDNAFDYALCLIDGTVWRVSGVRAISRDYVQINKADFNTLSGDKHDKPKYPFERGVDVRVDCIMWIADAPEGS